MNPKEVDRFREDLLAWYRVNQRPMPWRETRDPYRIWVSEVMLQQTRVATVTGYFDRFVRAFPDVRSLAAADLQEVLKLWEGLGYYTRVRNLHRAARQLVEQGTPRVPDDPEVFLALAGVGSYTAAAVQSIAFGLPLAVADGNVKRVLARIFLLDTPVNGPQAHRVFSEIASMLLDRSDPSTFNQAMMELGALVCTPRNPRCTECPVRLPCRAWARGLTDGYPKRTKKQSPPLRHRVAGAVLSGGEILIVRRKPEGFLGGMWEFPDAPLKKNADPGRTLVRELGKTTGLALTPGDLAASVKHAYTHFRLRLDLYLCAAADFRVALDGPDDFRWVRPEALSEYPLHRAVHKCLPGLARRLETL
jgi:A/G-specific adenine glycosylase